MIYALDTNIISYILNGNTDLEGKVNAVTSTGNKVVIPLMVYYEARRGLLANKAVNKLRIFERLCAKLNVNNLTKTDMSIASDLYAKRKRTGTMMDDGDLLIAAQCVTNNYTLITNNEKHFMDIDGLSMENWLE